MCLICWGQGCQGYLIYVYQKQSYHKRGQTELNYPMGAGKAPSKVKGHLESQDIKASYEHR